MKEVDILERDPDQLRCTTSSSCKRSCLIIFITFQFCIICVLGFALRNINLLSEVKHVGEKVKGTEGYHWLALPDRMQRLNENPVYAKFKIPRQMNRPKVNLLILVSSAPKRGDRRAAIRETWWSQSSKNDKVKVKAVFITDDPDNNTEIGREVLHEQQTHGDIVFQKLRGGIEFGKRFLYHLIWAMQNYDFDYFLRMDDDYFFCLDRFTHELQIPMQKMYHWGYVHCVTDIVRPEESMILLSRDLVERFLDQDPATIKCHPWADQMIATWVQELKLGKIYNHDTRLHHHPPLKDIKNVSSDFKRVCRRYIGVHGSYPEHTRLLWKLRENKEHRGFKLDEYTEQCSKPQVFRWESFVNVWRYKPKKFIDDPIWDTYKQDNDDHVYVGRQEGQG